VCDAQKEWKTSLKRWFAREEEYVGLFFNEFTGLKMVRNEEDNKMIFGRNYKT